jgi:hypothetical protein
MLVTACDPHPVPPRDVRKTPSISQSTPMRTPVAKTKTRAIIEFWDLDRLIWHKEKVNLFPRKVKTCYLEGENDIYFMTASHDGKLLYMRSAKPVKKNNSLLSIAHGLLFSLELPAEIPLEEEAILSLEPR